MAKAPVTAVTCTKCNEPWADEAHVCNALRVRELEAENARLLADPMNVGWQRAQDAIKDRAAAVSQWKAERIKRERAEAERDARRATLAERDLAQRDALRADAERMREPTEEMIVAGVKTLLTGHDSQRHYVAALWRRMFDAARKEKP